ncbi:Cytochrome c oxidase assembly protein cox15 [Dispira parvispora]|uniref:Cytochrome c oxidase assembly protein cox15 n=1 Tax=Dispira parvispora TaxID=1520584 RepID=A0A9W8AN94_9FUNG|nr:Cytochrome c oxidase assembly protein cox15 [Dispira parvispora]
MSLITRTLRLPRTVHSPAWRSSISATKVFPLSPRLSTGVCAPMEGFPAPRLLSTLIAHTQRPTWRTGLLPGRLVAAVPGLNSSAAFTTQATAPSTAESTGSHQSHSQSQGPSSEPPSRKAVGYWLLASAASVFGIVVWGGVTRLTESGLSIVEWNLIRGMKPPRTEAEWQEEFEKYKQFPEYKKLNQDMTLEEFKFIFFMEWGHRIWGRLIGATFLLPAAFFHYKGWLTSPVKKRVWFIAGLICFQGVLGWYMVKSGLDHALMDTPGAVPRVSPYRLAAHLGSAFLIYTGMVYTGLGVFRENNLARPGRLTQFGNLVNSPVLNRLRHSAHGLTMLVFFTAISGAFVAGLDAGLLYDTFPLMGDRLIPPKDELWDPRFSGKDMTSPQGSSSQVVTSNSGMWKNIFENPTTVQFNHRMLGVTTFTATTLIYLYARRLPLPRSVRITLNTLMSLAVLQVTLGISTLLCSVPTELAASHQAGSLSLLTATLTLMHLLKRVPK